MSRESELKKHFTHQQYIPGGMRIEAEEALLALSGMGINPDTKEPQLILTFARKANTREIASVALDVKNACHLRDILIETLQAHDARTNNAN